MYMKNIIISMLVAAILISCGGSADENSKADTVIPDKSADPDYQKGLAIVAEPKNLCLTCHKVDEKLVGPAYRDVANKYEMSEENINLLSAKVIQGGTGVWGEVAMPVNNNISPEDAKAAVKYILMLRNK
jgi:cytochrome c